MEGFYILMTSSSLGTCIVGHEALRERAEKRADDLNKGAANGVVYSAARIDTLMARMADDCRESQAD